MAMPPNKSSSPSMIAGRTSPNSRNSELGNPLRRSFSGNPFTKPSIVANPRSLNPVTPANSPSDYMRRNSVSREILFFTSRDNEEKENGKDQNPKHIRVRSPTVGKSSKHFMSPTISAASKVAVSPKKKILGDRNEPIRSSLSFSSTKTSSLNSVNPNPNSEAAAKAVESDPNPEIVPISNSYIAAPTPKSSKTVTFAGFEVISGSYDDAESTYRNSEVTTMAVETDMKPEIAPISSSTIAPEPHKTSKTVRFSGVEVISASNNDFDFESRAKNMLTEELDCVNLDPSFKISPVSSPMVAPLDADPLMPPYDPKTNYLSPRPQFLHYRPNRRIERGNRLEEFFSSVNVSESETEDSQKECDESSSDESEQGEEEEEVEEKEEEEEIHISEQENIEVKKSSKSQLSRMFKISALLLILSITFLSICAVVRDPNILERSSLLMVEHPSEIYKSAKMNFDVLVGKLEVWHAISISSISRVVSNLRGGAPSMVYLNQTEFLYKDVVDEQFFVLSHQTLWEKENHLDVIKEPTKEIENGIESAEREDQGEDEEEEKESLQEIEAMNENDEEVDEEEEKLLHETEAEANYPNDGEENDEVSAKSASEESLVTEENNEISAKSAYEKETEENYEVQSADFETLVDQIEPSEKSASDIIDEDAVQENEITENYEVSSTDFETLDHQIEPEAATGETEEETNESNTEIQYHQSPPVFPFAEPQSDTESSNGGNIEIIRAAALEEDHRISEYFSQNMMMFMFGLLLSLITLAGLIYARKSFSKKPAMAAVEEQKQPLLNEKTTNPSSEEEEEEAADDEHDDDDMTGESCSSETSSFQYSSMRGAEAVKESNEAQSHSHGRKMKKNSRRESMASSSLDEHSISASPSPSYGSFTTYERIKHHGNGEEETMTPVRRSSRIRKQHNNS